jgi:hypothetical protein
MWRGLISAAGLDEFEGVERMEREYGEIVGNYLINVYQRFAQRV